MSENMGASTSCNPKDLHGLYRQNFTFTVFWGIAPYGVIEFYQIARDHVPGDDILHSFLQ
jgi:hypothetical protein